MDFRKRLELYPMSGIKSTPEFEGMKISKLREMNPLKRKRLFFTQTDFNTGSKRHCGETNINSTTSSNKVVNPILDISDNKQLLDLVKRLISTNSSKKESWFYSIIKKYSKEKLDLFKSISSQGGAITHPIKISIKGQSYNCDYIGKGDFHAVYRVTSTNSSAEGSPVSRILKLAYRETDHCVRLNSEMKSAGLDVLSLESVYKRDDSSCEVGVVLQDECRHVFNKDT